MTAQIVPKPLSIDGTVISFPYINSQNDVEPIRSILVDIDERNLNTETVSLKYAFTIFHPKYGRYLKKHSKHDIYQKICDYSYSIIETPIEYPYQVGTYGFITNGNKLEKTFVLIIELANYVTEIFFLHDQLQKYKVQHYDITSSTPKLLTDEEIDGGSSGWIVESAFSVVHGQVIATTANEELLNWKTCREDYLQKKMNEMKVELYQQIDDRGTLFRETAEQCIQPTCKAFRGKITANNVGKVIEVSFIIPKHVWHYFLSPIFVEILQLNDEESFNINNNIIKLQLDVAEASPVIPFLYTVKLYDQNANAFKINAQIDVEVQTDDDPDDIITSLIDNMNEYSLKRYKKLRQQKGNKALLRKVKFVITINGILLEYNTISGKAKIQSNCYKIRYVAGKQLASGKIDFP